MSTERKLCFVKPSFTANGVVLGKWIISSRLQSDLVLLHDHKLELKGFH